MAFAVGAMLVAWFGGFLAIAILSAILERFAYRKLEPLQRAQATVGSAFVLAAVLAGFGMANGGGFVWQAGLNYVPGAIITFLWYYNRYKKAWSAD